MPAVSTILVNANAGQEGQNDFVKVSKADRDSYMRGDMGAENMREKYMAKACRFTADRGRCFHISAELQDDTRS